MSTKVTPNNFPMPNETIDGFTVVASVWSCDTDEYREALVILLGPVSPFFHVGIVDVTTGTRLGAYQTHYNIVEAVRCYEENGGDI